MPKRPRTHPTRELRPCVAELLRTCVHPSPFLLRVERVLVEDVNHADALKKEEEEQGDTTSSSSSSSSSSEEEEESETKQAYRLLLSDGELMIQATVGRLLHRYIELGDTHEGSFVDVRKSEVKFARRRNGDGEVIYLGITDFEPVEVPVKLPMPQHNDIKHNSQKAMRDHPSKRRKLEGTTSRPSPKMHSQASSQESEDAGGFETTKIDYEALDRRRHALHELSSNATTQRTPSQEVPLKPPAKRQRQGKGTQISAKTASASPVKSRTEPEPAGEPRRAKLVGAFSLTDSIVHANTDIIPPRHTQPQPRPTSTGRDRPAPPIHTLASLLHPPEPLPKSYACTVLAVITWVSGSLIHKPPYPPKRHIKIHDPSISDRYSGITVAVFIDAEQFTPKVGTVALFRGVAAQRWQSEIILNAYSNLPGMVEGGEWFVIDEKRVSGLGFDAGEIRGWWHSRRTGTGNGNTQNAG